MKKLMIAAAAAAMIGSAQAFVFEPVDCERPGITDECPTLVFKLTASGKTVQDMDEGAYKAVKSLKISKGALAFAATVQCEATGNCCYDAATLFAKVKVGKNTSALAIDGLGIDKWSVFGKNFEKALNWETEIKKGGKVTLDSDLFLSIEGGAPADDDEGNSYEYTDAVSIWASAFGKFQMQVAKGSDGKNNVCTPESDAGCYTVWTPKSYSGWFVGRYANYEPMRACFNCDCVEEEVFGGTWKASYQSKYTTYDGAQKLAFGEVLFSELSDSAE